LISEGGIRRIFRVYIKPVIGRADLQPRIIVMGLGVKGLRLGHPGRGGWASFPIIPGTLGGESRVFLNPFNF